MNLPLVIGGVAAGVYALLQKRAPMPLNPEVQNHIIAQAVPIAQKLVASGVPEATAIKDASAAVVAKYSPPVAPTSDWSKILSEIPSTSFASPKFRVTWTLGQKFGMQEFKTRQEADNYANNLRSIKMFPGYTNVTVTDLTAY